MAIDRLSSGHMQQSQEFANRVDARSFQQQQHSQDQTLSAIRDAGHTPERVMQAAEQGQRMRLTEEQAQRQAGMTELQMAKMRQQMQGNALRMATEKMRQQEYYQRLQAYSSEAGLRGQIAGVEAQEIQNKAAKWNLDKAQKEWEKANRDPYAKSRLPWDTPVGMDNGRVGKRVPTIGGGSTFRELTPEELKEYRARKQAELEGKRADTALKKSRAGYYEAGGRSGVGGGRSGRGEISIGKLGQIVTIEDGKNGLVYYDTNDKRLKVREATAQDIENAKKGPTSEEIKAAIKATEAMRKEVEIDSEEDLKLGDDLHKLHEMARQAVLRNKKSSPSGGRKITFGRPARGYEALKAKLRAAGKDEKAIERYIRERSKQK